MIKRLRTNLALLLSLSLLLSFLPVTAYADDSSMINISKRAPVDVVFVLDSTGSMSSYINKVKNSITAFLDKLYAYNKRISEASEERIGIDPRIAIIDYKDAALGEGTNFHRKEDGSFWFVKTDSIDDGKKLTATISGINVTGGGDGPETPTEALAKLYKADDGVADVDGFEWRDDAQKFVFLVTDADFKERKDSAGIPDLSEVTEELSKRNIHTSVATFDRYATDSYYGPLYEKTGGARYKLGDDLKFMEDIINSISTNIIITPVKISISAAGAPEGIGSVKLERYMDKIDGSDKEGPVVYCGDNLTTVEAIWGGNIDYRINPNEVKAGAAAPDGKTYVIDRLTVNGKPQDLSGNSKSGYSKSDLSVSTDTTILVLFTATEEPPEPEEKKEDCNCGNVEAPAGLPSDWTLLKHVTHENAISTNYCVIARKQRFDVKPYITGAVIYRSSDKKVASVGKKSGIVKGKKSGDAVITGYVKSEGQLIPTGSYTIHVVTPELNKKQYPRFNTDGSIDGNEHISNEVLIPTLWTSSDPTLATVSSNTGKISVLKSKGTAKINAFYGLGRNAARYKFKLKIRPSDSVE